MKKMSKFLCVAALVFMIIGFAFCIASLCFGFSSGDMQQVMATGGGQLQEIRGILQKSGSSISEHAEAVEFQKSYSGIKKLKIDVPVTECLLAPVEGDSVMVTGYGLPSGFSCEKSGSTLTIKSSGSAFDYIGLRGDSSYLEVSIPQDQILERLEVDAGVGEVTMENGMLICEEADIECGVGSCDLELDVRKKLNLECGIGEIRLLLAGWKEDYNYKLECGVGSIQIDEDVYSELGGDQKIEYGADRDISAECGVGSVTVQFTEETY